ncbi:MAG: hypothetical protein ABIK89_07945 [Planctomycetota bacterium]
MSTSSLGVRATLGGCAVLEQLHARGLCNNPLDAPGFAFARSLIRRKRRFGDDCRACSRRYNGRGTAKSLTARQAG